MQIFLHNKKDDFFKENRLCHFEKFSKSPEAPKEEPKKKESAEKPLKRDKLAQETAETLKPKKLTEEKAKEELTRQEGSSTLDLGKYTSTDRDALKIISKEFKGTSILLDNLEKLNFDEAYELSLFKGERISLRGLKLDIVEEDWEVLAQLNANFKGTILNRHITLPLEFKFNNRLLCKHIHFSENTYDKLGANYIFYKDARGATRDDVNDKKETVKKFEDLDYDFNGTGSSETESREKFAEEVKWIALKHGVSPLSIIWEEIFPKRSDINFTGGKVTTEIFNENLQAINKVESWITDNLL